METGRAAVDFVGARAVTGDRLPDTARVNLHFHPFSLSDGTCTLEAILRDRTYLSQFATGTSNGGLTARSGGDRWAWEHRIFGGVYDDGPDAERPVYGALGSADESYGPAPRFGSAHFRLRPKVLERTTFAYPDSTYEPTAFGVAQRMGLFASRDQSPMVDPLDRYIEAHVHGPVRIPEDVEALVLDPSFRGAPSQNSPHP
jgi:hypothetical protein